MSSGLSQRARGSLIVVPVGIVLLVWPGGTLAVTTLLILLATREAERLFHAIMGGGSSRWASLLLLAPLAGALVSVTGGAIAGLMALAAFLGWELLLALRADVDSLATRAKALIATLAVAVWVSPLLLLPLLAARFPATPAPWLLWLLAVVWSADTGALIVGRAVGRRRLAPLLSPRKSVEGLVGGVALASLVGTVVAVTQLSLSLPVALVASTLTATAAEGGDLLESLFKRVAGAESSSTLIPGHGGVLDRIDSILIATPIALLVALFVGG
jgi:phosphatidate cytidylyltransferase